jgi:hypothetical protein
MSGSTAVVESGTRKEVSLDVEDVVNGGVDRDEALGRAGRLEALHLALSSSYWLMGVFGPVVGAQTLVVPAGESNKRQSGAVGSQLVSNNDGRRETLPVPAQKSKPPSK